jgi:hypothetical protein
VGATSDDAFRRSVASYRGQAHRPEAQGIRKLASSQEGHIWSVSYLAGINHLPDPNRIYAGQRLWIPYHW